MFADVLRVALHLEIRNSFRGINRSGVVELHNLYENDSELLKGLIYVALCSSRETWDKIPAIY